MSFVDVPGGEGLVGDVVAVQERGGGGIDALLAPPQTMSKAPAEMAATMPYALAFLRPNASGVLTWRTDMSRW